MIALLECGDPDLERMACCGVANLAEVVENQFRIVERGALKHLVSALSSISYVVFVVGVFLFVDHFADSSFHVGFLCNEKRPEL